MKKTNGLFLILFLVACCIGGFILFERLFFPNTEQLKQVRNQCMQVKPGVTIKELTRSFGAPEYFKEEGYDRYLFGSHEYSVLYSDYIVAKVNEKGEITDFRCGEGMYPWK